MALAKVAERGKVLTVAELVPQDVGTYWIGVSHDWAKAVIVTRDGGGQILVVDLTIPGMAKACDMPQVPNASLIEQWLADLPVLGPSLVWYVVGYAPDRGTVQGMLLDPSIPCEKSFPHVEPTAAVRIAAEGTSGVADLGSWEGTFVGMDQEGKLHRLLAGSYPALAYDVPAALREGFQHPDAWIDVDNGAVMVLRISDKKAKRILVFRKSDQTWHVLPVQSDQYWNLRAFGRFIAVIESRNEPKAGSASSKEALESTGRGEWRSKETNSGPSILDTLESERINRGITLLGRLHLYDSATERVYTIATHQADSEVLLVEDNTVYYRVSNRFYSAPITEKGIGTARLLATAEAIRDAHWAFIKH